MVYLSNLAGARIGLGDYKGAIADLELVNETVDSDWFLSHETQRFFAQAYLGLGRERLALTAAQQALTFSLATGDQNGTGKTWQVLGDIAARCGREIEVVNEQGELRFLKAPECYKESLAIFKKLELRPSQARVLWRWAEYELGGGNFEDGKRMWQQSREIFGQLKLTHWLAMMDGKK
jgi:tetratricopeptide (TPR) repeat protein